jgi:hypothetical protein
VSPPDALWHLVGLLLPALTTGGLAAGAAKLWWRAELRRTGWLRLALWASAAAALASLGGLVAFGRDGRMATYGLMVLACAAALWWAGRRRS